MHTSPGGLFYFNTSNRQTTMSTAGTVKWFNESKGYGFIAPDDGSKDVFVHATALEKSRVSTLNEGDKVTFDTEPGKKGLQACNVAVVS